MSHNPEWYKDYYLKNKLKKSLQYEAWLKKNREKRRAWQKNYDAGRVRTNKRKQKMEQRCQMKTSLTSISPLGVEQKSQQFLIDGAV